jgi:hypothetical protein
VAGGLQGDGFEGFPIGMKIAEDEVAHGE